MNKKFLKDLRANKFLSGSLVMVAGSNLYNIGQFAYHSITGRLLGKAVYGDFASVISLLGLVGIIQLALSLTVVRFIARERNQKEVNNLVKWMDYWSIRIGILLASVIVLASSQIAAFLKISDTRAVILLAPIVFFFFATFTLRSALQGMLEFTKYVYVLLVEQGFKLVISALLILWGLALFGATAGLLLGVVASFFLARYYLRRQLRAKKGKMPNLGPIIAFSLPVFVQGLALTAMYTTDLLLVKHFFNPAAAGVYASLTVLGRVVFFGVSPITQVMFPIVTKRHTDGEPYKKVLYASLLLVLAFSVAVTVFYLLVPEIPILVLYGEGFLEGATLLPWFGLFMGLLGLSNMMTQFYLSVGKPKVISWFVLAAAAQAVLIILFHTSLLQVVQVSIASAGLLLVGLFVYFPYHDGGKKTS